MNSQQPQPRFTVGFSLLEVLVAFAILGLSLGLLLDIFSGGLRNVDSVQHYARATALAQSKLAALGEEIPFEPGEATGEWGNSYRWSVRITPYELEDDTTDAFSRAVELYHVVVSVVWRDGLAGRRAVLETLRVAEKP